MRCGGGHLLVEFFVSEVNVWDLGGVFLAQPSLSLKLVPLRVEGVEGSCKAHLDEKVPDEVVHYRRPYLRKNNSVPSK